MLNVTKVMEGKSGGSRRGTDGERERVFCVCVHVRQTDTHKNTDLLPVGVRAL